MALGNFRVTKVKDGLSLIIYGPKDLAEAQSGVRQAAVVVRAGEKMMLDEAKLADFLNCALEASHGNPAPLADLIRSSGIVLPGNRMRDAIDTVDQATCNHTRADHGICCDCGKNLK